MVYATTGSIRCFECGDIGHNTSIKERQDASVEAAPDDAVPLAEVSVANFDAV